MDAVEGWLFGGDGGERSDNSGISARQLTPQHLGSPLAVGRPGASGALGRPGGSASRGRGKKGGFSGLSTGCPIRQTGPTTAISITISIC